MKLCPTLYISSYMICNNYLKCYLSRHNIAKFNVKQITHDEGIQWNLRIKDTLGTIKIQLFCPCIMEKLNVLSSEVLNVLKL